MAKECQQCGKPLLRENFNDGYTWRRAKFCNAECYSAFHAVKPKSCPQCGAEFRPACRHKQFCSVKCQYESAKRRGQGHKYVGRNGYVYIKLHDHPDGKFTGGYVLEHRIVAEKKLGRRLRQGETIHHRNGVKTDNRSENIIVCRSDADHFRHHRRGWHGWFIPGAAGVV